MDSIIDKFSENGFDKWVEAEIGLFNSRNYKIDLSEPKELLFMLLTSASFNLSLKGNIQQVPHQIVKLFIAWIGEETVKTSVGSSEPRAVLDIFRDSHPLIKDSIVFMNDKKSLRDRARCLSVGSEAKIAYALRDYQSVEFGKDTTLRVLTCHHRLTWLILVYIVCFYTLVLKGDNHSFELKCQTTTARTADFLHLLSHALGPARNVSAVCTILGVPESILQAVTWCNLDWVPCLPYVFEAVMGGLLEERATDMFNPDLFSIRISHVERIDVRTHIWKGVCLKHTPKVIQEAIERFMDKKDEDKPVLHFFT